MKTNQSKIESNDSLAVEAVRVRHSGEVIWFDGVKGYGFIRPSESTVNEGKDLFVHFHFVVMKTNYKSLRKGDVVEFYVGENAKGACAKEVKVTKPVEISEKGAEA